MLVDLERNDLGRVCRFGSVQADEVMTLEQYSHVSHLVSHITGTLTDQATGFDLLKAMFPGGTITGVPKIRCMEIIEELEPVRRSLYTGSMGYLSWSGDLDFNILIRTLTMINGTGYLQVGAGIVADSDPAREYEETIHKAQALEKIALEDDYFVEKKLYPNVDFYSGIVQKALGIPTSMFTCIFALARTVGWMTQWEEMITDPEYKIGRPRQLYIGAARRDVTPLEKR